MVDADGRRSRQIDIAIHDNLYSPVIFPHDSGLHIAAESVYAIFEVKQRLTRQPIRDARLGRAGRGPKDLSYRRGSYAHLALN